MNLRATLFLGLLTLVALKVTGQVSVITTVDSTHSYPGDIVKMHVQLQYDPATRLNALALDSLLAVKDLSVSDIRTIDSVQKGASILVQKDISFSIYNTGQFILPPIAAAYDFEGRQGMALSKEILYTVMPIDSASAEPAPMKDIIEQPFSWYENRYYFLGGMLALLLGWLLYRMISRKPLPPESALPEKEKRPSWEVALEKLEILKSTELLQQQQFKEYHSELSYILREFLENEYHFPALESSQEDILHRMTELQEVDPDTQNKLGYFLHVTDLVKFAKGTPTENQNTALYDWATTFIKNIEQAHKREETVVPPSTENVS